MEDRWRQAEAVRLRAHCQVFSRIGWALLAQMGLGLAAQLLLLLPIQFFAPALLEHVAISWLIGVFCTYGVGVMGFYLILRALPAAPTAPRRPLKAARFLQFYCIAAAALYLSNYVTLAITGLIGALRGAPVRNPVEEMQLFPTALNLLLGCVIAPVLEELMFRKLLLDRLRPYGDVFAILVSALLFGLFHGNFSQLLYACSTGVIFAYVALKTGMLWQSILLHAMLNGMSVGLIPLLSLWGEAGDLLLGALVLAEILLGLVFFIALRRETALGDGLLALTERQKWRLLFENPGMALFCLLALCASVSALLF